MSSKKDLYDSHDPKTKFLLLCTIIESRSLGITSPLKYHTQKRYFKKVS